MDYLDTIGLLVFVKIVNRIVFTIIISSTKPVMKEE